MTPAIAQRFAVIVNAANKSRGFRQELAAIARAAANVQNEKLFSMLGSEFICEAMPREYEADFALRGGIIRSPVSMICAPIAACIRVLCFFEILKNET